MSLRRPSTAHWERDEMAETRRAIDALAKAPRSTGSPPASDGPIWGQPLRTSSRRASLLPSPVPDYLGVRSSSAPGANEHSKGGNPPDKSQSARNAPRTSVKTQGSLTQAGLGSLSAGHESGGDPGKVSTGKDDEGGISYGTYQFSTNKGTVGQFVVSPEFRPWASQFDKLKPGSHEFTTQWRTVAAQDPEGFGKAQHAFWKRGSFDPVVREVESATKFDLGQASKTVQDVAWSVAVQHGGAKTIMSDAIKRTDEQFRRDDPRYESAFIDNLYDRRTEYVKGVRDRYLAKKQLGKARGLQNVITKRYPQERADAQRMLHEERGQ